MWKGKCQTALPEALELARSPSSRHPWEKEGWQPGSQGKGVPRLSDPAVAGTEEMLKKAGWFPPRGPFCPWVAAEHGEGDVLTARGLSPSEAVTLGAAETVSQAWWLEATQTHSLSHLSLPVLPLPLSSHQGRNHTWIGAHFMTVYTWPYI